jgi:hypothetical protein
MKTLIATLIVALSVASTAKAETNTLSGSNLPGWAQKALSQSA